MSYGYTPIATIKDYNEDSLDKRIEDMEKRGYELIGKASRDDYYRGLIHYAKMKKEDKQ